MQVGVAVQSAPRHEGDRIDDVGVGQLGPGRLREIQRLDARKRFALALGRVLAQARVDLLLGHPLRAFKRGTSQKEQKDQENAASENEQPAPGPRGDGPPRLPIGQEEDEPQHDPHPHDERPGQGVIPDQRHTRLAYIASPRKITNRSVIR